MSDRTTSSWLFIVVLATVAASSADAQGSQVIANDPAALSAKADDAKPPIAAASDQTAKAIAPPSPGPSPVVSDANASKESGAASQAPQSGGPNEHKSLGKPNSALSARPVDHSSANPASGGLSGLDPRRNDVTRVLGALAIVIGLLLLMRAVVKRISRGWAASGERPSGVLEILARYPIGRAQSLVLLKVARRIILVHQNGTAMTALSEITDPDEVAGLLSRLEAGSSERGAAKFRNALTEFMADHDAARGRLPARAGALRGVETEVIDLTRKRSRTIAGFLGQPRKVSS
jgi:flagellar biogenesis protein FliO